MQDKGKGILEEHDANDRGNVPRLPPQPQNMMQPSPFMLTVVNSPTLMNINIRQGNSSQTLVRTRSLSSISPRSRAVDETRQPNRQILDLEEAVEIELKHAQDLNSDVDMKKLRRTVSNRLSAQRARQKKSTYIDELENERSKLENTIAYLTPRIESYKNQKSTMSVENDLLKQKLNTCTMQSKLSQIEIEKKRSEVNKLRELYMRQQQDREAMMMNNMMMQDEPWFGRFQNLGDFYGLGPSSVGAGDDDDNKNNFYFSHPPSNGPF